VTEGKDGSEEGVEESRRIEFPCGECGADMRWDPEADSLSCEHCGNRTEVPRADGEIVERGLDEAPDADRGLGIDLRIADCGNCGARVTFEGTETSDVCVYCGSPNVLAQEANRNAIRPESLVPLDVSRGDVEENFRRWIKGLWFRPNALKKQKRFEAVGIYVPFWTFDARVHSDWSADAGYYYYVTETYTTTVNGKSVTKTRQVRKTRWRPAWGERDDVYDDLLVPASSGQPAGLVSKLGSFDTTDLVPYRPEYLAGWRAEEYTTDLDGGWVEGRERIVGEQYTRCGSDVPGDTHRNLRVRNDIGGVRWKHVLLPIWSLQYRFGGKVYTVLIHGQTGRVVGRAPLSWVKILLLVFGVIGAILLFVLLAGGCAAVGGGAITVR
jgi:DNA-directed RNA polymerase subunit RPC12/RpoP